MPVSPSSIYQSLLTLNKVVSPDLQRHIFDFAKANKAYHLLAQLALVDNLDPAIDDRLAGVQNYLVQSAYLRRPGRDLAVLSLRAQKDSRVAVCQSLASMSGLTDVAYSALAKHPSRTVALELVSNPAASASARTSALTTLILGAHNFNWAETAKFRQILSENVPLLETPIFALRAKQVTESPFEPARVFLAEIFSSRNAASISLDELSPASIIAVTDMLHTELERTVASLAAIVAQDSHTNSHSSWRARSELRSVVDMLIRATTSPSFSINARSRSLSFIDANASVLGAKNTSGIDLADLRQVLLQTPAGVAAASPAAVAKESDPNVLVRMAEEVDPTLPTANAMARAILENPNSPKEVIATIAATNLRFDTLPAILAHASDLDFVASTIQHFHIQVNDSLLSKFQNPKALMLLLLQIDPSYYAPSLGQSAYLDQEVAAGFPVSYLSNIDSPLPLSPGVAMALSMIATSLGDDVRLWELFDDAVTHAPSSIGHLLSHVHALAALTKRRD